MIQSILYLQSMIYNLLSHEHAHSEDDKCQKTAEYLTEQRFCNSKILILVRFV